MRIWLPDAPGVLGAVAAEIGAVRATSSGSRCSNARRAWPSTSSWWSCPTSPARSTPCAAACATSPGPASRRSPSCSTEAPDREDTVLAAAAAILQAATPTAAMNALTGHLMSLFDLSWLALADDALEGFVEVHGDVPSVQWVAAFAEGSRSGADPANDTTGSGVFVEPVPETGLTVCGGRPVPIRRRERHEIAMLVMVASRFIDALGGRTSRRPV